MARKLGPPRLDADVARLLQLLANCPRGELSTVLHFSLSVSEAAMTTALARGLIDGRPEPLKGLDAPPIRLMLTAAGAALAHAS